MEDFIMNKKMREIKTQIETKMNMVKGYMGEETKDLEKAEALLNEIDSLQKEYTIEEKMFNAEMNDVEETVEEKVEEKAVKANGFTTIAKMLMKRSLNDSEKALVVDGANGENNLLPEDVKLEINELRKQYISAKNLVTVETTDALSGSVNYESGAVNGLVDMTEGADIDSNDAPSFARKQFNIKFMGKLIPVSRILLGSEKAGLLAYINRWFVKNAIVSENAKIFETLKAEKEVKAIVGLDALKTSINVDLDPACLVDGVIVTNQTGFAALDGEVDGDGRGMLQPNPVNPTQKMFNGLPIHVFSDAQLANVGGKAPIFYGSLKAGATFVEHTALEFATSEHVFFGKNQNALRVIEGFDVMGTDKDAYVYGTFEGMGN
jgi:HK97 family phage major capsid protein